LIWRFHLDPDVTAEIAGPDIRLSTNGRAAWLQPISIPTELTVTVEDGWLSPSYGVRSAIRVVVLRGRVGLPQTAMFRFGLAQLTADRLQALGALMPSGVPASLVGTQPCVNS